MFPADYTSPPFEMDPLAFFAAFSALTAFTTLLFLLSTTAGPPRGRLRSVVGTILGALVGALEDETKQKIRKDYNSVVILFVRFVSDILKLVFFGCALVCAYWVSHFVPEGWGRWALFIAEFLGLLTCFGIAYREAPDGIMDFYKGWTRQRAAHEAERYANQEIPRVLRQAERMLPAQEPGPQEDPEMIEAQKTFAGPPDGGADVRPNTGGTQGGAE